MQRNSVFVVVVLAAVVVAGIGYYSGRRTGLQEARGDVTAAPMQRGATVAAVVSATGEP